MISGHVTVCKVYKDGTQETVLDRANLITAGLGSSFLDIQQDAGSTYSDDYAPAYFQLGTDTIDYHTAWDTSTFFYQVCAPFGWSDYGEDTDLDIVERYRGFNASTVDGGASYTELLETSAPLSAITFSGEDQYFAKITEAKVSKIFMDSFEAQIVLDENTANGKAITEVGLFARNPKGYYEDSPLLMAYRSFAALNKTSEFSLIINWTIGFLGLTNNVDDHYTGDNSSESGLSLGGITKKNTIITG
jgi:hypothetical protein